MSATTQVTTFSDIYTDVLNRVRANTSDTTSINLAKRYVNKGLHDIHIQRNWPWAERKATLNTHAPYSTGTVAIALAARTTVTGTSTLWNTAVTGMGFNNTRVGGKMKFSDDQVYEVSAVGGDTSITLASRYIGDTALSGAAYTYYEDEYALASDFWRLVDARMFSPEARLPVISRVDFYRRYPRNSTPGQPRVTSIIEIGPVSSTAQQQRVLIHPYPDAVYNIPYRYITSNLAVTSAGVGAANLSGDTDEPIIPLKYRHVLVLYAVAQWYRDRKDDERTQLAHSEYVDLVTRMGEDSGPERDHPRFISPKQRYLRGSAGYGRLGSRRYQTGSEFDDMVI